MIKKLLFLLLPTIFYAQIPAYYSSIDFSQTGENLKVQLATLITNTHTTMLPYTASTLDTWDVIQQTDQDPNVPANVLLVYGYDDTDAETNNDRSRNKTLMGTSSCIGYWNREHTFPQSLSNPPMDTSIPGVSTDVHHVRASDCQFNSTRSNKIYDDGAGVATSVTTNTWYPGDEWKGDVARMMMYLYVRYGNVTPAATVGAGSRSYSPLNDMPNIFLEWNTEDPVSQFEMNRNNILQTVQGNRNPFIDNPYLATIIWNGPAAVDSWGVLTSDNFTLANNLIYPTITSDIIYIRNNENIVYKYSVYNTLGQLVSANTTTETIDLSNNAKGIYFVNLESDNKTKSYKVILN